MDAKEQLAIVSIALSDAQKQGQSLQTALDSARANLDKLEALLNPPVQPNTVPPVTSDKPRAFTFKDGKLANMAAPYLVHYGEWQHAQTIADKKSVIDLIADMGVWNGVTVFCHWKETNAIPAYIQMRGLDWWADTLNKAYTTLSLTDYRAYVGKLADVYGAVGGVIDDAQNFSDAQMAAMCQPLWDMGVPVIASYGGTFDVAAKHPSTVNRTAIAWQLYYKRSASNAANAGTQVATMLKTRGRCDVANDDVYRDGSGVPSAAEFTAAFAACQAAGIVNHAPYAALNYVATRFSWKDAPELVEAARVAMRTFWLSRPS